MITFARDDNFEVFRLVILEEIEMVALEETV
jgi:hypothetical protein